jgi:hypothetical protein
MIDIETRMAINIFVAISCHRRPIGLCSALSSVENVKPEADERRFTKKYFSLTKNNRKTRFWVVARLHLWAVEHCEIEMATHTSSKNQKRGIKIFELPLKLNLTK